MDTTLLVNPHKIRSSVKRLFTGRVTEILAELLQNSQRASSRQVNITTAADGTEFKYQDDGQGLKGVEGFYKFLSLGDSGFDESVIENQAPMGIGFGSLLAHESVTKVTVTSNGLSLEIDTKRWWDEQEYYQTWESRLELSESSQGFCLDVKCDRKVIDEIKKALPEKVSSRKYWKEKISSYPALGYKDVLEITLDGIQTETGPIDVYLEGNEIVNLWIDGNKLTIYSPDTYHWDRIQLVNWYGQLIKCNVENIPFRFVFEVRNGRPINPKAPVREGFIEDKDFLSFQQTIEDALFAELCSLETIHATPENIKALYKTNPERANNECPYITAAPCLPYEPGENSEWESEKGEEKVFLKENAPLLIKHEVRVTDEESCYYCYYGVSSFVEEISQKVGTPYEITCASTKPVKHLIWKPGEAIPNRAGLNWLRSRGEFCLTDEEPTNEAEWHKVERDVFAFSFPSNWDIEDVEWTIGCEDPIKAISELGYAGFDPENDDRDRDELMSSYENSMDELIERLSPPPPIDSISGDLKQEFLEHAARRLNCKVTVISNLSVKFNEDGSLEIAGNQSLEAGETIPFCLSARVYE